jgi:hypothetical protein
LLSDEQQTEKGGDTDEQAEFHQVQSPQINVYEEGSHLVFENEDGEVVDMKPSPGAEGEEQPSADDESKATGGKQHGEPSSGWRRGGWRRKMTEYYSSEVEKRKEKGKSDRQHEPARAYQFGNMVSHSLLPNLSRFTSH